MGRGTECPYGLRGGQEGSGSDFTARTESNLAVEGKLLMGMGQAIIFREDISLANV